MACSGSGFNEDFTGIAPLSSRGFDAGKDWVLDSANAMMKSVHEGWSKINGPSINIPSNDFSASWALKFPTVPNAGNNWMELNKVYLSFTDAQERNGFTVQFKPLWWANKNPKPDGDMVLKAIIDENSTKIINQHTRIAPENGDKAEWIKLNLTVKNGVAALSAHFTATNQKRTYTAPINIPEDVRLTKLFVMHRTGERDKERCFPVLIDYMRIEGCEPDGEQERLRIADATMYGNHGKGFGVTSSNSLIASGLYFDGSGNYVDGGAFEGIRNPETFTLSAWLKRAGGPKEKVIISKQDDGNGWRMGVDKKHHGCFITHQDTMANETALDQLKQWYHIAATYNGTAASLFIDGAPVRSEPVVVRHAKELPVYIGKWMNGDFYRGMLDEIRVLNTALSGSAIRLDYETQKIDQRIAQPPPIAPQAVRAKYGEEKDVIISWKLHGTYIDSTEIQRTENDSIWQTIAVFLPPQKSFRDTNIVCGSTYGYRVRHWFGTNASPWSVQQEVNVPRCGTPRDLVSITTTAVNSNDKPLNRKKAPVVVNLYDHPTSGKILYTETCTTSVRKGYITILLGLNRDIRKAVETHTVLYAALEIDGFTQEKRVPLTAEGITVITDDYRLSGKGSPGKKAAPVGALYVDIKTNELYVKYGEGGKAWGKITPLP